MPLTASIMAETVLWACTPVLLPWPSLQSVASTRIEEEDEDDIGSSKSVNHQTVTKWLHHTAV